MAKALPKKYRKNYSKFLKYVEAALTNLKQNTSNPQTREIYSSVITAMKDIPVRIQQGKYLYATKDGGFAGIVTGEHRKQYQIERTPQGMTRVSVKPDIRLPFSHVFDEKGNLRLEGMRTIIHEFSHITQGELGADLVARRVLFELLPKRREEIKRLFRGRWMSYTPEEQKFLVRQLKRVKEHAKQARKRFPKPMPGKASPSNKGGFKRPKRGRAA